MSNATYFAKYFCSYVPVSAIVGTGTQTCGSPDQFCSAIGYIKIKE